MILFAVSIVRQWDAGSKGGAGAIPIRKGVPFKADLSARACDLGSI
jgi:hypothetical protein